MSFDIKLRRNLSEPIKMDKSFAAGVDKTYSGNFRGEISIIKPVFNIETTDDLTMYNYAEINAFGRKYFAVIRSIAYKIWEVTCEVDTLSTYAAGIRACSGLIKRTEKANKINYYLNDGTFYTEQREIISHHILKLNGNKAKMGTDSYYLLVAGG